MSNKKQRIVLEGLSFKVDRFIIERESEIDDNPFLQDDVHEVIGRVISAPAQLLGVEPNGPEQRPQEPVVPTALPTGGSKKRRRPQRRHSSGDAAAATPDDHNENGAVPRQNTKPNSARSLIQELNAQGFFEQDRAIAEIREELLTRGHSFKSNEISPTLLSLTKQKLLARRKDEAGRWSYRAYSHGKR